MKRQATFAARPVVAATSVLGIAFGLALPWASSGSAHLHWLELATSPLAVERAWAWTAAGGFLLALAGLWPNGRKGWSLCAAGGALAASAGARPTGFALARALEGDAVAVVGPGALAVMVAGASCTLIGLRRLRPGPARQAAAVAWTALLATGLLPLGRAQGLLLDEATASLAALDGGPLARPMAWHGVALACAAASLALACAGATGWRRPGLRWAGVAAGLATAAAGVASMALWWDGALGVPWNPSLVAAGLALAALALVPSHAPSSTTAPFSSTTGEQP